MARLASDDLKVMTINDAVYPLWIADIAYASDAGWWRVHRNLPGFQGWKIRPRLMTRRFDFDKNSLDEFPDVYAPYTISGVSGFDPRTDYIRSGQNGGYQAVHIAAHLGAREIILVGFDYKGDRWFGKHPSPIRKPGPQIADEWVGWMDGLCAELKNLGIRVVVASPSSALRLPRVDLETELERFLKVSL